MENLNSAIFEKNKFVIKSFYTKKIPGLHSFTDEFYYLFKEYYQSYTNSFYSFYEANIIDTKTRKRCKKKKKKNEMPQNFLQRSGSEYPSI